MSQAKSIFKSKTAIASALTFLAGTFGSLFPEANQFLASNASAILLVLGILNIGLRFATKGRVVLFAD